MGTPAEIYFEGSEVTVYKHWDGYPEDPCGVVSWLAPFVAEFWTRRGHDPEYLPARLLMYLGCREAEDTRKQIERHEAWAAKTGDRFQLDRLVGQLPGIGDALSYGLMSTIGAGRYVYYVDCRGGIHVLDNGGSEAPRAAKVRWTSPLPTKPASASPDEIPEHVRSIEFKIRAMPRLHYLPLLQDPQIEAHVKLWRAAGPGVKEMTFPGYLAASLKGWPYTMTFDDTTRAPKGRRIPFPITAEQCERIQKREAARKAKAAVKAAEEGSRVAV